MDVMQKRFSPGTIAYHGSMAANYEEGRALSHQSSQAWREVVEAFIPRTPPPTILDLGAGTGRFVRVLAAVSPALVIAIEPSFSMLTAAVRQGTVATVAYVAGTGEGIPLRDGSCDAAWLSHVFHHVRDRSGCAEELARVVRPGGRVLVRGTFSDRLDGFPTLFQFFPGARRICEDLPTTAQTRAAFENSEFALEAHRAVQQLTCGSLREFAARTSRRADTSLTLLSDDEFEAGLMALRVAAARESTATPVVETVDLLVFQRQADTA
jgi:ubiquinone/menaquinone biosynthesis C-methylase UbiE